jgi:Cu(I)/Ag(I) efflux system membrane fusion protein
VSRRDGVTLALAVAVLVGIPAAAWWVVSRSHENETAERAAARVYRCPMHPTLTSDQPGDCPVCGMPLDAVDDEPSPAEPGVPSTPGAPATVTISPSAQQTLGVATATVARARFVKEIRAVGRVTHDETRLRVVHTKVSGFVERLHADAVGKHVREGEPLLEIFSPELLSSQQEYLVAVRSRARARTSSVPSVARSGDELVESARRRLELFDLTDAQIRDLETTGLARRTVTVFAPASGTILERAVTVGQRVEPGTPLLTLANLSRVWVVGSVFEHDLPFVRVGQRARIVLPYEPGAERAGAVSFLYPEIDPGTRAARVRVELPNPGLSLKPDMYADVVLEADLGDRLSVPASAVVETGVRSIAFVEVADGRFEPREISIGVRLPDRYEVRSGLAAGDRVVASGSFFVDSESKIRTSSGSGAAAPPPDEHRH